LLLTDLKGAPGAAQALLPALASPPASQGSPAQRIQAVQLNQDRLIDAAETYAKNRADRLKLAAHTEQKVEPYYLLTVAKGGPKFKESTEEGEPVLSAGPNSSTAIIRRVPISQFIDMIQTILRTPIVDQTGLKGRYDADLNIGALISTPIQNDDITGTVITAVQDLLGLKLEPKKGPIGMLVVDHAEKVPTEN